MISQELVRELQKKIDISYEEAEHYLKKSKGNIDMALFLIHKKRHSRWERMKSSVAELMKYKIIITRKEQILINIPVLIFAFLIFIYSVGRNLFPLIVLFIIALVLECEVRIYKEGEEIENNSCNDNGRESQQKKNKYSSSGNEKDIRKANIREKLAKDPNLKRDNFSQKMNKKPKQGQNSSEEEKIKETEINNLKIQDKEDCSIAEKEAVKIDSDNSISKSKDITEKRDKEIQIGFKGNLTEEDGFYEITIDK